MSTSRPLIPWQRFWVPRGTILPAFLGPGGLTHDRLVLAGGMTLEDLRSRQAVALLGEPGMGKTTTLKQDLPALQQHFAASGAEPLTVNLASHGSEARLERALFENATVERWKKGTHALHLILDSFDECHLRLDTVGGLLSEGLRTLPRERLFLRVACRPAIWPGALEDALRELWPSGFLAVELAPLSREDIHLAARENQVDPDAFSREVERLGVAALAARPVTLKLLLGAFQRGALPRDRWQLYLDGCLQLAQENSRSREESSRLNSKLGREERLAIASRIAALTLLSNREPIRIEPDDQERLFSITIDELTGGEEEYREAQSIPVTREAIREVLDSGLFRAVDGPRLLTWAHRTYEEFLAALFLRRRDISPIQLRQLLGNPGDSRPGIVMQLQGLAAWLVAQDSAFRQSLLELDPWMLLSSDALVLDDGLRAPLVQALLESARRDPALGNEHHARSHYPKLAHPDLEEQLRRYLREPGGPAPVRSLALRIALVCEQRSLIPECIELALDSSAPTSLRAQALDVVWELGGDAPDARLLPLARLKADEDAHGELRDRVLPWLWPGVLPTEQLFDALREPGEDAPLKATQMAIQERLPPEELPVALRWSQVYLSRRPLQRCLAGLTNHVLHEAFEYLDTPGLLEPYCAALWPALKRALRVEPGVFGTDEARELPWDWTLRSHEERWRVIDGLAASRESPDDLSLLARVRPPLLFEQDFAALLLRTEQADSPKEQACWAQLISCCYPEGSSAPLEAIFRAIERDARLESAFSWLLKPKSLEERPEMIRVRYADMDMSGYLLQHMQRLEEPPESIEKHCDPLLQQIESGVPMGWFPLLQILQDSPDQIPDHLHGLRWRKLSGETRARIVRAARSVLPRLAPAKEPWLEGKGTEWHTACIHEAFHLLAACDPEGLDSLPERTWRTWATLIMASGNKASDPGNRCRRALVERACRHAPVDVMRAFRRILSLASEGFSFQSHATAFLQSLTGCWNEMLQRLALEALRNPATDRIIVSRLLEVLLSQEVPEAQAFAESLLHDASGAARERRADAARILLTHGPATLGPRLWAFLQTDTDFAREVLTDCIHHGYQLAGRLEPELLADIYLWLEHHGRPPAALGTLLRWSWMPGPHPLQKSIRERLTDRMTRNAEAALERLCRELPGDEALREKLFFARQFVRARTWAPPSPQELLELVGPRRKRLVRNGQELLDVVVESLQRLEQDLHSETPAIRFLWNRSQDGRLSPKDELHLSDWVKRHLVQDLAERRIVVNREVEVRPTLPGRPGERVDLWVDAIANRGGVEDRVSVLIEVKLAYHRQLWTAMEGQLVGRYLAENQLRYGIYLVGWYACPQWDETTLHPGEGRVALERARELLEVQARALSQGGVEVRAFVLDAAFRTERAPG